MFSFQLQTLRRRLGLGLLKTESLKTESLIWVCFGWYNGVMGKLMRRRDVCEALGVSADQVRKIVDCGLLKPIRMPGRRAWFRAADVRRLADG